jgi:ABC-type transporter Mla subunit MlaD
MIDSEKNMSAELASLRQALEWVVNGLRQMLEVQATHTQTLQAILDAATTASEPEQDLAQTLSQMLTALSEQTKVLTQIHSLIAEPA